MPSVALRVFFDNVPAGPDRVDALGEIRVAQEIGMAAEAELELPLGTDAAGTWSGFDDAPVQPFGRVRVEVKVGDGEFTPLIDGPVVGQRYRLSAAPEQSRLAVVVQDDSVLLNREEKVALFENMASHEIAQALIAEHGLTPEVDTTPAPGAALPRVVVQRGTNMQLLKELARRHGMFAFVRPGAAPGRSVGVLQRPRLSPGALPELLLLGAERNVAELEMEFDALRPVTAAAGSVKIADKTLLSSQATAPDLVPLGDTGAHAAAGGSATTLLARMREEQADLDAATIATVNLSSWAYGAAGEVDADLYAGVLQPHLVVRLAGAGHVLSGDYLVSAVTHVINDESYRQRFTLRRNARSASGGPGAAPGGIF